MTQPLNSLDRQLVEIRSAVAEDAERVASLSTQLGYPATADEMRSRLADLLDDASHAAFVAQASDSQVAAWIHVFQRKTVAGDGTAEIGGLIVDESSRGSGIGRASVERAAAWAREQGCGSLGVRSNVVREDAHRFYTGLGFGVIKSQTVFRKAFEPVES